MRILALALLLLAPLARAIETLPGGYLKTGEATRQKKVALVKIKVYDITHSMKQVPSPPTRQAMIDADVDKKFDWVMLRDVDAKHLTDAMREAYQKNGYTNQQKIDAFIAPLQSGLHEDDQVMIFYDAGTNTTSLLTPKGRSTVPGRDFMKATWSIWFGNIDQPELGDQLLGGLR